MAEKHTHTPGPWKFSFESVDPEWAIVTTEGGSIIANVNADFRQEANAHLIAAAPAMLAALDRLEKAQHPFTVLPGESRLEAHDRWFMERQAAAENARAAIAQAKGE